MTNSVIDADPRRDETTVVVVRDFDGYFEQRVRQILSDLSKLGQRSAHRVIHVKATPYLADAVQYEVRADELHLTFYSGLRTGFGELDWGVVADLIRGPREAS